MRAALREVWLLFRYYPLRWSLSLVALIVGMGTLTALMTLENNITRHTQALIAQQGGARLGLTLTPSDIHAYHFNDWCTDFPNQYQVVPYYSVPLKVQLNEQPYFAEVIATTPHLFSKMHWALQRGRALHELDKDSKVVVIGAHLAQELQEQTNEVMGSSISLQAEHYTVIGVLDEMDFDPILNFDPNQAIFMHLNFAEYFMMDVILQDFVIFLQDVSLMKGEQEVNALLSARHPNARFFIKNPLVLQKVLFNQIYLTVRILKIISGVALFLGLIAMFNQFIMQLEERKSEMGVRLAFGASIKTLAIQLFKESLIVAVLAGIIGLVLGVFFAVFVLSHLHLTFYWALTPLIISESIALLMGGLIGLICSLIILKHFPYQLLKER